MKLLFNIFHYLNFKNSRPDLNQFQSGQLWYFNVAYSKQGKEGI